MVAYSHPGQRTSAVTTRRRRLGVPRAGRPLRGSLSGRPFARLLIRCLLRGGLPRSCLPGWLGLAGLLLRCPAPGAALPACRLLGGFHAGSQRLAQVHHGGTWRRLVGELELLVVVLRLDQVVNPVGVGVTVVRWLPRAGHRLDQLAGHAQLLPGQLDPARQVADLLMRLAYSSAKNNVSSASRSPSARTAARYS